MTQTATLAQRQRVPGWYVDQTAQAQRYWDGTAWTDQLAPLPPDAKTGQYEIRPGDLWGGFAFAVIFPLIGFIVGLVWLGRGKSSPGVACMVLSLVAGYVWLRSIRGY
jgi:Protein of unknown function (DUF2510)